MRFYFVEMGFIVEAAAEVKIKGIISVSIRCYYK